MEIEIKNKEINAVIDSATSFAKTLYGDKLDKRIVARIQDEARMLVELGMTNADLIAIRNKLKNYIDAKNIYISRFSNNNSFIYYLLGISNINPLPRHSFCKKCHTFFWGNIKEEICPICGEKMCKDGFDLPFALLNDDIKKLGFKFNNSSNKTRMEYIEKCEINFKLNPTVQLAIELGLTQEDLNNANIYETEIIKCLDKKYYSKHYLKEQFFEHQAFIGLPTLGSDLLQEFLREYEISNFNDLIKLIGFLYGTRVYDSCEENLVDTDKPNINDCITYRDDIFKLLKQNQFNDFDASIICRETRANGAGHLSSLSEDKLKEAGVEEKYINFLKGISYIFHKGHVIGHMKLEFALAKIYLEDPVRYYKAYFSLNKDLLNRINENDDFIKLVAETIDYNSETFYLGIIDLIERGENINKILRELKIKHINDRYLFLLNNHLNISENSEDAIAKLRSSLSKLEPIEERILRLRFGLDDDIKRSYEQIGKEFGYSKSHVYKIVKRSITKLSNFLK